MKRPETTLFMLMSVDGKISTGDVPERDVDKDFPTIKGIKEGLHQYYDLEKTTDLYSFNTGKVFAKIGVNEGKVFQAGVPAYFILVDNRPHLTESGVKHLLEKCKGVYLITTNKEHPAYKFADNNKLTIWRHDNQINFEDVFSKLKSAGADRVTIQSGGTLNAVLIRNGFIDNLNLVIAPIVIGGENTPTIVDGEALQTKDDLLKIRPLELVSCTKLESSYIRLEYKVIN